MFKKFSLLVLALSVLIMPIGCAGSKLFLTGACSYINTYKAQVEAKYTEIQTKYQTYLAIVQGLVVVPASVLIQAQAWISAADATLKVFGAVIAGVCPPVVDVQLALNVGETSLPKLAIPEKQLEVVKMQMKK
jgi:hypothetical protein